MKKMYEKPMAFEETFVADEYVPAANKMDILESGEIVGLF